MSEAGKPVLLVLNQMAGPMTWELVEDCAERLGPVALLTGHPDTLAKRPPKNIQVTPAAPYHRGSYARRVLSWLRYLGQALLWVRRFPKRTPLLLFSNPPLLPWLGYLLSKLRGQPYSVMVHDIYPDLMVGLGKLSDGNPVVRLWRALNRRAYESAELVMTLGEFMAERLARQFDPRRTPAAKIEVIYPWADTEAIRPLPKERNWFAREHGLVDKTTVMYSGNMGMGHDIETILRAAGRLRHETGIHFMFIGAGPKWSLVERTIRTEQLPNVTLLGWQPEEVLPYSMTAADVAVVSLEQGIEGIALPSKAFSFLAAGAALLLISREDSELANIVAEHHCGWTIPPGRPDELVRVVSSLRESPGDLQSRKTGSRRVAETLGSRRNSETILERVQACRAGAIRPGAGETTR